eukprot:COSAG02_NODE_46430_length_349_cov_0.584000_2_plen_37_part_01
MEAALSVRTAPAAASLAPLLQRLHRVGSHLGQGKLAL